MVFRYNAVQRVWQNLPLWLIFWMIFRCDCDCSLLYRHLVLIHIAQFCDISFDMYSNSQERLKIYYI